MSTASKPQLADLSPEIAAYLAEPRPPRVSCLDENGRLRPLSPAEQRERAAAVRRSLAAIEAIGDDSDDIDWDEAERDLDSFRPHRPLFTQPGGAE